MNIRKDNYISTPSHIFGRVMSVNKSEDSVTLYNGVVIKYSECSKISKAEYDNHYFPLMVVTSNEVKTEDSNTPKINKKEIALETFRNFVGPYRRRDMIKAFMSAAELSKMGAATYYYNITSGKWEV